MDLNLKGRVAAVAAGSAGLGYASALTLAHETGAEVFTLSLDMSESDAPRRFVQEVADS